ncbi:(2Fe-2S)-binding protein [Variovorax sp. RHLX14]|uniref:(2Fe-2S)-binding protein n=1 Tax=Variovorax sp. RHLX14 TaxID=1259731 RepID=UPI003F48A3F8
MSTMTDLLALTIDGRPARVEPGTSVAAALRIAGDGTTRTSVTGMARAPLCGMGICQECRVDIDGRRMLACQTVCSDGMRIRTESVE